MKNENDKNYMMAGATRKPTIAQVKEAVAKYYDISVEQLIGQSREHQFLMPREVAIFICHKYVNKNYSMIARQFGNRDHTTIMNAVNRIKKLRIQNKNLHLQIVALVGLIMSGEKPKRAPRRGCNLNESGGTPPATKEDIKRLEEKLDHLTKIVDRLTEMVESWQD